MAACQKGWNHVRARASGDPAPFSEGFGDPKTAGLRAGNKQNHLTPPRGPGILAGIRKQAESVECNDWRQRTSQGNTRGSGATPWEGEERRDRKFWEMEGRKETRAKVEAL